jgi:osmotically-inducible protein OsmY
MSVLCTSEIHTRAEGALRSSPIFALRELHVESENGRLLLSGLVGSFYPKQLAQEVVLGVAEGVEVVNDVKVNEMALRAK